MATVTNHLNPLTSLDPTAPPPPQPPRSSFSCDRHPQEQFAGICPSCLCERLTTLDHSSNSNAPSSSRRPSNLKPSISSLFPELRRTKSFSASENDEALFGGAGLNLELQRKSCDVRARSSLWSLFEQEKEIESNNLAVFSGGSDKASTSQDNRQNRVKKIECSVKNHPVFEEIENAGDEDVVLMYDDKDSDDGEDEIRPVRESNLSELKANKNFNQILDEEVALSVSDSKAKKHHYTDANSGDRGKKGSGGGLWAAAASVFSKKWQKWRHKQKAKKNKRNDTDLILTSLHVEKSIYRQYMETQSEIAHYSFGRRSCDTDPRFSLDAARISFDEPRASWDDGYLICKSIPKMALPKASVLEEDNGPLPVRVIPRSDTRIPVEDMPGGSMQTKEYYADCSSRRRKSLDRSGLVRRGTSASLVAAIDDPKAGSSPEVSPATTDYLSLHSLKDADSEAFELGDDERKEVKKSKKWSLKLWGFKEATR